MFPVHTQAATPFTLYVMYKNELNFDKMYKNVCGVNATAVTPQPNAFVIPSSYIAASRMDDDNIDLHQTVKPVK